MNRIVRILGFGSALLLSAQGAFAQCENKSGFAKLACQAQTNSNGPFQAAKPDAQTAITTGFPDTIHVDTLPASIEPKAFKPLAGLDRTDDGAFVLKPGIYEAYVQSYTLDPGDGNFTKAGGYYPAPIKGTKARIVASLLKQIELHPDVSQSDVQVLLLNIVQGVDLEKMPPNVQQIAVRVLPKEIVALMQGATQAKAFQQQLMNILNQRIAKDKNAEAKMNQLNDSLKAMQQQAAANPTFKADAEAEAPVVRGTWAQMPGGFYVRYLPDGYMKTRLQLMVPDEAVSQAKAPLTFDPTEYLAVLGQAPSERIGITLRPAR